MKLAVVGSRNFDDYLLLWSTINALPFAMQISEIVSGGAAGADSLARQYAREWHLKLTEIKPNWSSGKHAGMQRNSVIVSYSDLVIAFWDGKSKGTADTINKATKAGKLHTKIMFEVKNEY